MSKMDFLQLLPPDVIFNHVFNHLDVISKIRAATTCRAWRHLLRAAPSIPDMPYLLIEEEKDPPQLDSKYYVNHISRFCLRDLALATTTGFHFGDGEPFDEAIVSGDPWLTIAHQYNDTKNVLCKYTVCNPFTRQTFRLPCFQRFKETLLIDGHWMERHFDYSRVLLSSNSPDCLVAAWDDISPGQISFCRTGDLFWAQGPEPVKVIWDMIFYRNKLYAVFDDYMVAYDVNVHNYRSSSSLQPNPIAPISNLIHGSLHDEEGWKKFDLHLVESEGELLVVTRPVSASFSKGERTPFFVYRLDEEKGELVRVRDVGERMLFVQYSGLCWSRSGQGPATDGFFTTNCIYFVHFIDRRLGLCKYEMGTGLIDFHPGYSFHFAPKFLMPPSPKY